MVNHAMRPLLELRENELVHHGMVKQQEALLAYARMNDYAGIYALHSQAVGSTALVSSWKEEAYRYYLMARLSEVQWLQRDGDDAIILWDLRNEVVVILRLREENIGARILGGTVTCEEAEPVGAVA